ncbi:MAG: IS200/IS605 family transposase [bacterium]
MGYVKIWIHAVWITKNREHYLVSSIRRKVFDHIKTNAGKKGIYIDYINGYVDHIHSLISLNADQNIAEIMQTIKGESSRWINKNKLLKEKFGWQKDYYAASISKSHLERVRGYIRNQEIHHSSQTLGEEIGELFPGSPEPDFALKHRETDYPALKHGETDNQEIQ